MTLSGVHIYIDTAKEEFVNLVVIVLTSSCPENLLQVTFRVTGVCFAC